MESCNLQINRVRSFFLIVKRLCYSPAFDRQGWDYVDASQVPGFYNPDNEPKISAAPGDNTSWLRLTWEFFTGTGLVERQFGPDSTMTKGIMTSPDIPRHRQNFIDQSGGTYGPTDYRFGVSSEDSPITSSGHMSREFVGSYAITITEQANGDALFVLQNTISLLSLLIQPVERSTMHPLSNKSQTFWWVERGVVKRYGMVPATKGVDTIRGPVFQEHAYRAGRRP